MDVDHGQIRGILDQRRKTTTRLGSLTNLGIFALFAGVTAALATGTVAQETSSADSLVANDSPVIDEKSATGNELVENDEQASKPVERPIIDAQRLAMEGVLLSAEEAGKLEEQLKQNEDDVVLRTQLLGHYSSKRFRSDTARRARQQHVLWIIENRPDAEVAGLSYAVLDPYLDLKVYSSASALWRKQVDRRSNDARILGNAANFFLLHEKDFAESLLKKARAIEPSNPHWARQLGHFYKRKSHFQSSAENRKEAAAQSLEYFEEVLGATRRESGNVYLLADIAQMAIDAGETEKAETHATDLLVISSGDQRGHAIHHGNLILGRVALKRGEIEGAKKYLIAAGKTSGSPPLNSFGPSMALAKELLEQGEQNVVLEYFDLCKKFWKLDRGRLQEWTALVKAGQIPNFGTSLIR